MKQHAYGRSKLFIRNPLTLFSLEEKRKAKTIWLAIRIQSVFRGFVKRKKYKEMKAAQIKISSKYL